MPKRKNVNHFVYSNIQRLSDLPDHPNDITIPENLLFQFDVELQRCLSLERLFVYDEDSDVLSTNQHFAEILAKLRALNERFKMLDLLNITVAVLSLPLDKLDFLYRYCGGLYSSLGFYNTKEMKAHKIKAEKIMQQMPKTRHELTVFRGIRQDEYVVNHFFSHEKSNTQLFVSTTLDEEVAHVFSQGRDRGAPTPTCCVFKVIVPIGGKILPVSFISSYSNQSEVLLLNYESYSSFLLPPKVVSETTIQRVFTSCDGGDDGELYRIPSGLKDYYDYLEAEDNFYPYKNRESNIHGIPYGYHEHYHSFDENSSDEERSDDFY